MRSFQQFVVFLFALVACAVAQDSVSYDATVYITSTVYRVNTITLSGSPTASVANSTVTGSAVTIPTYYPTANGTVPSSTGGSIPSSTPSDFPGAASHVKVNALLAAVAAGIGYLAL